MTGPDRLRRLFCRCVLGTAGTARVTLLPNAVFLAGGLLHSRQGFAQPGRELAGSSSPHRTFIQQALEMRRRAVERGDQPYGAVVVKNGQIIGEGVSAVVTDADPTAHAEMQAIRQACKHLRSTDLTGCVLYGSSRACPMCESAAYWARISQMIYGEAAHDGGAPRLR